MRLAHGALSVDHVGNDAARSDDRDQVALPNVAVLHLANAQVSYDVFAAL